MRPEQHGRMEYPPVKSQLIQAVIVPEPMLE
jgi:hypothetical protein